MMTTSTRKNNDKNYYEVLEECYTNQERVGEPELADTNATQMRWTMMMMPLATATTPEPMGVKILLPHPNRIHI